MTDAENSVDCLSVFQVAVARWLNVSEIVSLLTPGTSPLAISPAPPSSPPPSGTLLLYDRSKTRNYKADGYDWIRKRNSTKVREDHVKLRVGGQYRIAGCYVHSSTTSTFHRRAYHLLDPDAANASTPPPDPGPGTAPAPPTKKKQSLVLVHYLDTEQASAVSASLSDNRIAATSSRQQLGGGGNGAARRGGGSGSGGPPSVASSSSRPSPPPSVTEAVARDLREKTRVAVAETRKQHPLIVMPQRDDREREVICGGAHTSYELADDHLDGIEAIKLSQAKHRLTASFDDDTLGMLWDMVMDEGGSTGGLESHVGDVDELKEAARTAIEQHLTPDMEEQLVSTVEQAVLEAAASTAVEQHMFPGTLEQRIEEVVDAEVVSTLDSHLPSDLEEQLVATMEQSLYGGGGSGSVNSGSGGGGNIMGYSHDTMMLHQQQEQLMHGQHHQHQPQQQHHYHQQQQQQQHQHQYQQHQHQHQHRSQDPIPPMQTSATHAMAAAGSYSPIQHGGHHSGFASGSLDTKMPAATAGGPGLNANVPPSPVSSDRTITPTPLPDIIDFTPAEAHIRRDRELKIVVSTAASIPKLPPDDPLYVWHRLAAFVDIMAPAGPTPPGSVGTDGGGGGQPSPTGSSTERAAGDAVFRNVALSPLRQLTPFSYKCDAPAVVVQAGRRSVILLGVRLAAGTDPVCNAVSAAVTLSLQAEWNAAIDKTPRRGTIGSVMDRPVFYAAAGGVNVQLLSQLSQDSFDFIEERRTAADVGGGMGAATPERPSTGSGSGAATTKSTAAQVTANAGAAAGAASSKNEAKASSESNPLPAPAPAMASIASALIKFPNPPKRAVVPKPAEQRQQRAGGAGDESDLSEDEYGGAANYHPNRKRRASAGDDDEDDHDHAHRMSEEEEVSVTSLGKAAKEWVSKTPRPNSDATLGDSVNRHCKIRFVERLANVVVGTESGGGDVCESVNADGAVFLSDEQLQGINDEELDSLLDSVLIRFVESLVEQSEDDDELKEELNAPGFSGFTLLHYASLYNLKSLVPLLLSRGANPDITSLRGNLTPLHLACGAGHFSIVELLARNGCDVDVRDSFGQTPANHADRNGFRDISAWLRERSGGVGDGEQFVPVSAEAAAALVRSGSGDATDYLDDNKVLMRTAFSKLSLKDKLSLNFFVRKYKRDVHEGVRANTIMEDEEFESADEGNSGDVARPSGTSPRSDLDEDLSGDEQQRAAHRQTRHSDGDDSNSDDCSFISEEDQENLDVAMSMMSKEELEDMESNATYSDVRKWMLRSNYESLREASMQLQLQSRGSGNAGNKRGDVGSSQLPKGEAKSSGTSSNEKTTSQKNSSRDVRMGPKRSLNHSKLSQALAMLVIRKNLLAGQRKPGAAGLADSEEAQK